MRAIEEWFGSRIFELALVVTRQTQCSARISLLLLPFCPDSCVSLLGYAGATGALGSELDLLGDYYHSLLRQVSSRFRLSCILVPTASCIFVSFLVPGDCHWLGFKVRPLGNWNAEGRRVAIVE